MPTYTASWHTRRKFSSTALWGHQILQSSYYWKIYKLCTLQRVIKQTRRIKEPMYDLQIRKNKTEFYTSYRTEYGAVTINGTYLKSNNYSKTNLDAQFFEFIEYHSTCFGRSFHPSSGVQDCTYSIKYMSYSEPALHIPDAVCTVLDSWWWMERPSETCRVIFNKLEKLCI